MGVHHTGWRWISQKLHRNDSLKYKGVISNDIRWQRKIQGMQHRAVSLRQLFLLRCLLCCCDMMFLTVASVLENGCNCCYETFKIYWQWCWNHQSCNQIFQVAAPCSGARDEIWRSWHLVLCTITDKKSLLSMVHGHDVFIVKLTFYQLLRLHCFGV